MIHVDKFIPGGQSISTMSDGRKIFFWNALPGEDVVKYDITKKKSHYYEAIATDIENPSPYRVKESDQCYLSTSPWQILSWDYENQTKSALVEEIFHEHHIDISVPPILTDNQSYHYRNKMEYALYWDNEKSKIELAFHTRGSHRKLPVTQSSIERPEIFSEARHIVDHLNSCHEEARSYQSLLLRCNQEGRVSGGLYRNGEPHPSFPSLTDTILGYTYSYSPNGFFQINLPVYELALKEIKKHINTENVLDLYAGVGTIGLSVARARHLVLVEVDKSAYAELYKNCKNTTIEDRPRLTRSGVSEVSPVTTGRDERVRNGSIRAVNAKSENVLNYISPKATVILDPPRAGCDRKLIDRLLEVAPPTIIYLSCNPATQARDVSILLEKYTISHVQPFNFFPRTPHIENLIVLERKASETR